MLNLFLYGVTGVFRMSGNGFDLEDEAAVVCGEEVGAVRPPDSAWEKPQKRRLGTLKGKGKVIFADDFSMTDEELINL
jgi:hypothetical protein